MKFVLPPYTHEATQVIDTSLGDRNIRAHNHQARLLGMRTYMRHDQTCIPHIIVRVYVAVFVKTYHLATLTL
jgi:hypothetical protein